MPQPSYTKPDVRQTGIGYVDCASSYFRNRAYRECTAFTAHMLP